MGTNNLNVAPYPGRSHVFNVTCTRTRFQCYTACNIENVGEACMGTRLLKMRIFRKTNVPTRVHKSGHNSAYDQYIFL